MVDHFRWAHVFARGILGAALFLAVLSWPGGQPAADSSGKGEISIELSPASTNDSDSLSATAFGVSLAHWYTTSGEAASLPVGIVAPSPEALRHAFSSQLQIWREMKENKGVSSPYMAALLSVEDAGFLDAYIWSHHRGKSWASSDQPGNLTQYGEWAKTALVGHVPRMEARLNVISKK